MDRYREEVDDPELKIDFQDIQYDMKDQIDTWKYQKKLQDRLVKDAKSTPLNQKSVLEKIDSNQSKGFAAMLGGLFLTATLGVGVAKLTKDPITGVAVAAMLAPFGIGVSQLPTVRKTTELEKEVMKKPSAK